MKKYYVMRSERDMYGNRHWFRLNMRTYVLSTAKRLANKHNGYVCRLGTTDPVYVSGGAA